MKTYVDFITTPITGGADLDLKNAGLFGGRELRQKPIRERLSGEPDVGTTGSLHQQNRPGASWSGEYVAKSTTETASWARMIQQLRGETMEANCHLNLSQTAKDEGRNDSSLPQLRRRSD